MGEGGNPGERGVIEGKRLEYRKEVRNEQSTVQTLLRALVCGNLELSHPVRAGPAQRQGQ